MKNFILFKISFYYVGYEIISVVVSLKITPNEMFQNLTFIQGKGEL